MPTHHPDEHYIEKGTPVVVPSRNNLRGVCNCCDSDPYGWDILVLPDNGSEPFWTGSRFVVTADQWDDSGPLDDPDNVR
jgi:hypothetical protein